MLRTLEEPLNIVRRDENVFRLHIPMDNAFIVYMIRAAM
jgi:hypothetical protein